MLGYLFDTEIEVLAAQKLCDDANGIPVSPESETKHWVSYEAIGEKFVIWHDESIGDALGNPLEIEAQALGIDEFVEVELELPPLTEDNNETR